MKWRRYRFYTNSVDDPRPLVSDPRYPWWESGIDGLGSYSIIIAFLPENEPLARYWDDAYEIEYTEEVDIFFTDRFPMPDGFVPS